MEFLYFEIFLAKSQYGIFLEKNLTGPSCFVTRNRQTSWKNETWGLGQDVSKL